MLTWKHYLRPYNTIRRLRLLADAREGINGLIKKNIELLQKIVENQQAFIMLKDAEIARLKADVKLLEATTVRTVDPITRDGVLDPPEPKSYIN